MYGGGGLTIGNFVRIAAHTVMVPSNHEYSDTAIPITKQGLSMKGIVVEDDVWVGAGARILDGVRLRTGTVVGAGAVLTHSTNEFSVVAGVPARQLATRTKFAPSKS
ncbi:MAG: acyltransferase [Pseudomonadota bacterium]